MKHDIIHLLPKRFPFGAYAMLDELHFAFNKYHSDEVNQKILYIQHRPVDDAHFHLDAEHVDLNTLHRHIVRNYKNPVVLFHKLSATDCTPYSQKLYKKIPFLIINHTQTSTFRGIAPCNMLVCVSKHMIRTAKTRLSNYNLEFVRNGVNACRYEDIPPIRPNEVQGYFATGRLNNFNHCKHPTDWVQFVKTLNLPQPVWHDYVGSGKHYKNACQQASKRYRVPKHNLNMINLPGRIDNFEEKVGYIKRWKAFLYEIRGTEGTSMALLEAMACGVPAIINDKPGNREIIEKGVNGYVYKDRKDAIKRLTRMMENPSLVTELQQSTKELFLEKFDARHMAKNYLNVINETLQHA